MGWENPVSKRPGAALGIERGPGSLQAWPALSQGQYTRGFISHCMDPHTHSPAPILKDVAHLSVSGFITEISTPHSKGVFTTPCLCTVW